MSGSVQIILIIAGFAAGMVDAVAGGGGLITVPALLFSGLPTAAVLGTNKGQAVFGSATAVAWFWRAGRIQWPRIPVGFIGGFAGSWLGAWLATRLPPQFLRPMVLVLLVVAAAVLALRRDRLVQGQAVAPPIARKRQGILALTLGAYDGFFGPGTGTFLLIAHAMWLGDDLTSASAHAKVINFASNLAAFVLFSLHGAVIWSVALPMAVAQMLGSAVGAKLAIRNGDRMIRRVVLVVVAGLVLRLGWDLWR